MAKKKRKPSDDVVHHIMRYVTGDDADLAQHILRYFRGRPPIKDDDADIAEANDRALMFVTLIIQEHDKFMEPLRRGLAPRPRRQAPRRR